MIRYYHLNGQLVPAAEASLLVSDLSILRGYGIFDYFLVRQGQPLFIEDYLDRFYRSAELLFMTIPASRDELRAHIMDVINANGLADAGMRLLLTGGYAEDGYTPVRPNLLILQHPPGGFPEKDYRDGVKLISHHFQREIPEVKSINYVTGIRLIGQMKAAGATEVLYHDGQHLRETVRANLFLVMPDDQIITPGDLILRGITRKHVMQLARERYSLQEQEVPVSALMAATEVFITSSTKGVLPVTRIDDLTIGGGRPGPVTQYLMERWEHHVNAYLQESVSVTR